MSDNLLQLADVLLQALHRQLVSLLHQLRQRINNFLASRRNVEIIFCVTTLLRGNAYRALAIVGMGSTQSMGPRAKQAMD